METHLPPSRLCATKRRIFNIVVFRLARKLSSATGAKKSSEGELCYFYYLPVAWDPFPGRLVRVLAQRRRVVLAHAAAP